MSDKLHRSAAEKSTLPEHFALPDHAVVELSGRDATAFAQAQLMNDVAALETGRWQWNGWLTPKGRLLALFALLKRADDCLWLVLPDRDPATLADGLRRYLFRSKVAIAVRDDLRVIGRFAAPAAAQGAVFVDDRRDVELDLGTAAGGRCLLITAGAADAADADAPHDDIAAKRWKLFDLEHGLPRLPDSQVDRWTPQQLSLDRLRAFSIKKGCYPGQEIVARTHFLGKAKRGLALLQADGALKVDAEVRAGDTVLGRLMASADAGDGHVALAVLPLQREPAQLRVDGQPAREAPMKDGLSR